MPEISISNHIHQMRTKINQRNDQFNRAIHHQDGHALSLLYTVDAVLYPPKQVAVKSREAIAQFFDAVFKSGVCKGGFRTQDLVISGDYAFEAGEYVLLNAEDQQLASGFYLYVWQYVEEEWYLIKDIWND